MKLSKVSCNICGGTGKRAEAPQTGPGDIECNGCRGSGKTDDWRTNYPFSAENARGFSVFLKHCGGFEIC